MNSFPAIGRVPKLDGIKPGERRDKTHAVNDSPGACASRGDREFTSP